MTNFFNSNLKYVREKKGLSKNKLGELVGVNQSTIGRWENKEITPSIDNVIDLMNALNIPLSELGTFLGHDMRTSNNTINLQNIEHDYKKILQDKGLMDENEKINEEKIDDLMRVAEMMKKFNSKE